MTSGPRLRRAALVGMSALLLTGCAVATQEAAPAPTTPSPSAPPTVPPSAPSPAPAPPLESLVLSPNGLGSLTIGSPIDPRVAVYDPQACFLPEHADAYPPESPAWGAWVPLSPEVATPRGSRPPFEPVAEANGPLTSVDIWTDEI